MSKQQQSCWICSEIVEWFETECYSVSVFQLWRHNHHAARPVSNAIFYRLLRYSILNFLRGNWSQYHNCASNAFIVSYQLRLGLHSSGVSLVNDMNVVCSNDSYIYGKGIKQGNWTSWEIYCPRGACGFSARIGTEESVDDDILLNDFGLICCPWLFKSVFFLLLLRTSCNKNKIVSIHQDFEGVSE